MIEDAKRLVRSTSSAVNIIGMTSSIIMMFIVTADVVLRYLFKKPIHGADEMSIILLVVMVYLGLGSVQSVDGHVKVEQFVDKMKRPSRLALDTVLTALALIFFIIVGWRTLDSAIGALQSGSAFEDLQFSTFSVRLVIPIGVLFFCFELLLKLVLDIAELNGKKAHE